MQWKVFFLFVYVHTFIFQCICFLLLWFCNFFDFVLSRLFYFPLAIIIEKQRELDSTKTELKKAFSDKKALKGRIFMIHTILSALICNFMQLERNSLTFGEACKFPTSMYHNKYRIYLNVQKLSLEFMSRVGLVFKLFLLRYVTCQLLRQFQAGPF